MSAGRLRLAGLVLLAVLIARLDLGEIREAMRAADPGLIALSVAGIVPLILIKTVRWQGLLRAQAIRLATVARAAGVFREPVHRVSDAGAIG